MSKVINSFKTTFTTMQLLQLNDYLIAVVIKQRCRGYKKAAVITCFLWPFYEQTFAETPHLVHRYWFNSLFLRYKKQ